MPQLISPRLVSLDADLGLAVIMAKSIGRPTVLATTP